MRNRTPRQILGDDLHTQLIFEGYEVVSQNALADARSQAYEECAVLMNDIGAREEASDGLTREVQNYYRMRNAIRSQAIRQHSQKGEDK